MDKLRLYLDTCVVGYLHQPNEPLKMRDTLRFWEVLESGDYDIILSDLFFEELLNTPAPKKEILFDYLGRISYTRASNNLLVDRFNLAYLNHGVLSANHKYDLLHIAYSVAYNCDFVLSWNFRHFVNSRTIDRVNSVNELLGYRKVCIVSPAMFLDQEVEHGTNGS